MRLLFVIPICILIIKCIKEIPAMIEMLEFFINNS